MMRLPTCDALLNTRGLRAGTNAPASARPPLNIPTKTLPKVPDQPEVSVHVCGAIVSGLIVTQIQYLVCMTSCCCVQLCS